MATTSIQIDSDTRKMLARLKSNPRETYDELLRKFMMLVPEGDDEGTYADAFRAGLLESMVEMAAGKTIPMDEVRQRLGL